MEWGLVQRSVEGAVGVMRQMRQVPGKVRRMGFACASGSGYDDARDPSRLPTLPRALTQLALSSMGQHRPFSPAQAVSSKFLIF
jgi:hypothetical protein